MNQNDEILNTMNFIYGFSSASMYITDECKLHEHQEELDSLMNNFIEWLKYQGHKTRESHGEPIPCHNIPLHDNFLG